MGLTRFVHMLQVEEAAGTEAPGRARQAGSRGSLPGSHGQLLAPANSGELAAGTAHPAGSGGSQPKTSSLLSAGMKMAQDFASLFHSPCAVGSAAAGGQPPSPSRVADLSKSSLRRAEQGEEDLVQECKAVRHGLLQRAPPGQLHSAEGAVLVQHSDNRSELRRYGNNQLGSGKPRDTTMLVMQERAAQLFVHAVTYSTVSKAGQLITGRAEALH